MSEFSSEFSDETEYVGYGIHILHRRDGVTDTKSLLFNLGAIAVTTAANEVLSPMIMVDLLSRHMTGDWGIVCDEDKALNNHALNHNQRLLSSYVTNDGIAVWIITEADRLITTILLPSDY